MKVSYNWLKEFVDPGLNPEELADKLTLIGLEVEEIESFGSSLDGVIVGEVLEVVPHPNADRLQLCQVDLGEEKKQIVCGAKNVAAGQKVPVATVGSTLPIKLDNGDLLTIKKAKLRGEVSEGMICAEDELGIGTDHAGIMVLDEDLKIGTPVSEIFDLYEDTVIDIAITPNRPDATCHLGVARDAAAALNKEFRYEPAELKGKVVEKSDDISIEINSPDKCHRYSGILIKGITIDESPAWLQNKLKAIGVRPVNNVVDATNYVMFELGQPLHAFDYNQIAGKKIVVTDFDEEIEFETLDHVNRKCAPGTLFICDGEKPVAIAGVMGGLNSEVSDDTNCILIESAYFDPGSVRKTAKEQSLQTDASYRFERGIDPTIQAIAAQRAADLIIEIAGGQQSDEIIDIHPVKTEVKKVNLRIGQLNRLLGTEFSVEETLKILDGLELEVISKSDKDITFHIPPFRPDLEREVDLIEEVGRLYDYNNIESPSHGIYVSTDAFSDWEILMEKIRTISLQLGFREIYTNSLISEKEASSFGDLRNMIPTLNPLTKDMSTLRPSLLHGFLKSASYNFNRKAESVRFFEIGNVFWASEDHSYHTGIREETHLLMGLSGAKHKEHWSGERTLYSAFDLKSALYGLFEKLGIKDRIKEESKDQDTLLLKMGKSEVGRLFRVSDDLKKTYDFDNEAYAAELSLSLIAKALEDIPERKFSPVPKFPAFDYDFAVIVEQEVAATDLLSNIRNKAGNTLHSLDIFDVFEGDSIGKGKKSLAFRLSFLDPNKTLNIKEIEPIINRIVNSLEKDYSAKLRS
ncbi:phenylalanine--tRNA ligase subunit beta [Balneola sp. MJW-20]|uniref:phenylalanine--tRNA ligase subunit beta n=1 Tax=Gracilimonas aurantiaca TaxID=3234185 RepID=UPI003464FBB4